MRKTEWSFTPAGQTAYTSAKATAQGKADSTGYDHGIEPNNLFKHWHVFMLPQRRNRTGHELQCEVVMCTSLATCQPGHGPCA